MPTSSASAPTSALMRSTRAASTPSASGSAGTLTMLFQIGLQDVLCRDLVARAALLLRRNARIAQRRRRRSRGVALVGQGDREPIAPLELAREAACAPSQ